VRRAIGGQEVPQWSRRACPPALGDRRESDPAATPNNFWRIPASEWTDARE